MPPPPYLHTLTIPTPFPVGPVNAFLIEGDPPSLVDTGPKAGVSREALEAGLAAHGCRVEDLGRVIITHHHVDHMGLAGEVVARSGAAVWTHPYNFAWLADTPAERGRQAPFYHALWRAAGVPLDIVMMMDTANSGIERWLGQAPADGSIDEGQTIELGGEPWQVFHTPGHAGGLVCLWEPRTRTLLANDHLLRDISSNPVVEPPPRLEGPRPHRLVEYLHHMRRMAALEPTLALPGHGDPVDDVPGLVRQRVAFHERRARRLHDSLDGEPRTLWELSRSLFPRVNRGLDYFLAMSEVLGHLDLLEESGRARPETSDDLTRWHRL